MLTKKKRETRSWNRTGSKSLSDTEVLKAL
jgi:hypothetical protein